MSTTTGGSVLVSASQEDAHNEGIILQGIDFSCQFGLPHCNSATTNDVNLDTSEQSTSNSSSRKRKRLEDENEDDDRICSICFNNWTNVGHHRLCALKCGHLFGHSCIEEWFQYNIKENCPLCNQEASSSDIRFIYARKLIVEDVTAFNLMKKQLSDVRDEKARLQQQLTESLFRECLLIKKCTDLNIELNTSKSSAQKISTSVKRK